MSTSQPLHGECVDAQGGSPPALTRGLLGEVQTDACHRPVEQQRGCPEERTPSVFARSGIS